MRARRWSMMLAGLLVVAVAATLPAGAGTPNPNWFNEPVQGPSPNASHVVGNEDGGECAQGLGGAGITLLGGREIVPGRVVVELMDKDAPDESLDPPVVREYAADADGDWGATRGAGHGAFPIPAGLEPGEYPLRALCASEEVVPFSAGGIVLGQVPDFLFSYETRSYTVIAQRRPDDPVRTDDLTFTG
ncbi:MAG TPA: hypothetical protein VM840_07945 [Actinomycetota bacterium]|nr:hypothetical protein [Actinomycetota bacterium]